MRHPTGVNSNFCCRTHRLATTHNDNVTDDRRRRTSHCSISAIVSTVG